MYLNLKFSQSDTPITTNTCTYSVYRRLVVHFYFLLLFLLKHTIIRERSIFTVHFRFTMQNHVSMVWGLPKQSQKLTPIFARVGNFCSQPLHNKGHVTSPMLVITSMTHTIKAPRDQLSLAPPATLKACIQPKVFNIVF